MSFPLFLFGLAKLVFGVVVGAIGIFCASRLLRRLMKRAVADEAIKGGNVADGILEAAALVSFGIVCQHAVTATFSAMDLMYRGHELEAFMLSRFAFYAVVHIGASLFAAAGTLAMGTWIFGLLTRGVDELAEVRKGNIAPALVLGAVMLVLALMMAPGLQTMLDGLLPLPTLQRDEVVPPS
jgi:uncharacterized membrane protein YjfL (UPF0719 family)